MDKLPTLEEMVTQIHKYLHYGYHPSCSRIERIELYIMEIQRKLREGEGKNE